ncbi:putative CBF/NF-Y family transcription factor [Aspergillus melleus]|uniref:putative CBF/NF-Y family transcription factor n=1 Tax=Aspergillus melleus TaxID=138277 RepID=UPI001E8EEF66|nr:uncharacterized protein LDX57_003632 [Aspergillus melleus]KAH8425894.1 hypothetical protein LDX57_003632 [Aspergillus melleus]
MPRKSTSSTPGDLEETQTQIHTQSPDLPDQSPSQPVSQSVQATEQQLKARASIDDYLLPRSLTLRLAKSVLPPNTSLQKDAVLAIQKAATVFVSYLSSHANEATLKRTLSPADVFSALSELELEGFRPRLEKELDAFTDLKAGKRKSKGGNTNTSNSTNNTGAAATAAADVDVGIGKDDATSIVEGGEKDAAKEGLGASVARGAKRVKRDVNGSGVHGDDEDDDGDETQDEPEKVDENETEVEEEDDEEEEDEDEDEVPEEEDPDRVEDLDRDSRAKRTMDPDAAGDDDTESEDENGPGSQLRGDLGLG